MSPVQPQGRQMVQPKVVSRKNPADGEAERNDETELVDVVVGPLGASAISGARLFLVAKLMPVRSRRSPEIRQSPRKQASLLPLQSPFSMLRPFLFQGHFSPEVAGGLWGTVFQGD